MKIVLKENKNAYEKVGNIIMQEAEKIYNDYNPCNFIVFLGLKYKFETENERHFTNEIYFNNDVMQYWDNDWWEGEPDIEILGFTSIDRLKEPMHKL